MVLAKWLINCSLWRVNYFTMSNFLTGKKIHFIGIGGAGVSALARLANDSGAIVTGSDANDSVIVANLREQGIAIVEHIPADVDLVVYSVAVPGDNQDLASARERGLTAMTYPQALGALMRIYQAIGVAGTNGKTTTTAMLASIMINAGADPTVVVGSDIPLLNGNARLGASELMIFESDEYRRAFANYHPYATIITYVGFDHPDYYQDQADVNSAFDQYLGQVDPAGFVIVNNDDETSVELVEKYPGRKISFGIDNSAEVMATNIRYQNGKQDFDLIVDSKNLGQIELLIPGRYNVYNALAAIAVALQFKVSFENIQSALGQYQGAKRRFEIVGQIAGKTVISDYAHTPDAVSQTIAAAREFYAGQKVLTVFQPHHYSRTKELFNDFAAAFDRADQVIITDIFFVLGRENPDDFSVSSEQLAKAAVEHGAKSIYGGDLAQTEAMIRSLVADYDVILLMGAGSIDNLANKLIN